MKIAIIGGGSAGEAFVNSLSKRDYKLLVVEKDGERAKLLAQRYKIPVREKIDQALSDFDVVLLCVKPQDRSEAFNSLRSVIKPEQLLISIMAGVPIATISSALSDHKHIIRSMPNLALRVQKSMTVYVAGPYTTAKDIEIARKLFKEVGEVMQAEREELMDAVTAVSGSGPGFLFYFLEHMINAALKLGFSGEQAKELIAQTLIGTQALWKEADTPPNIWRAQVTSKGGTTEAGMEILSGGKVGELIEQAIVAAERRSRELGGVAEVI